LIIVACRTLWKWVTAVIAGVAAAFRNVAGSVAKFFGRYKRGFIRDGVIQSVFPRDD
jgi:hypothetical protein